MLRFIQLLYEGMIVHVRGICPYQNILLDAVIVTECFERHKIRRYMLRNCLNSTVTSYLVFLNKDVSHNEFEGVYRLGALAYRNPELESISDNR
jgi:hypothetical protein